MSRKIILLNLKLDEAQEMIAHFNQHHFYKSIVSNFDIHQANDSYFPNAEQEFRPALLH